MIGTMDSIIVVTVAMLEPVIAPIRAQLQTRLTPSIPRMRPKMAFVKFKSAEVTPVSPIRLPDNMKSGTARRVYLFTLLKKISATDSKGRPMHIKHHINPPREKAAKMGTPEIRRRVEMINVAVSILHPPYVMIEPDQWADLVDLRFSCGNY
jgi:hypothetical protein